MDLNDELARRLDMLRCVAPEAVEALQGLTIPLRLPQRFYVRR